MKKTSLAELTPEQYKRIAKIVGTSPGSMRHMVKNRRGASAERAIAIENAAKRIGLMVTRESMNAGCKKCEFAKACRNRSAGAVRAMAKRKKETLW